MDFGQELLSLFAKGIPHLVDNWLSWPQTMIQEKWDNLGTQIDMQDLMKQR